MNLLLDRFLITQTLEQSIQITQNVLKAFATAEDFTVKMTIAFGDRFDAKVAQELAQDWSKGDFTALPPIAILSTVEINGAMGAFAKATNTIYLSREYLAQNADNPEAVASVLLEEVGHYIDSRINELEAPGDEGAIFSALVRGETLSEQDLQQLRAEDDFATILLDGQMIIIEQAIFTGNNNNNRLPSGKKNKRGNDTFDPRLGNDTVDGGAGTDLLIVDYSANTYSGLVSSGGGINGTIQAQKDASGNFDSVTYTNIEKFNIKATNFDDIIYGGALNDTLHGEGGDDYIDGGNGNNILNGGDGNDTVLGGTGNDTIDPGLGNDSVDGGLGTDRLIVNYSTIGSPGNGLISSVATDGRGSFSIKNSINNQISFINSEQFNVTGTDYDDTLIGGALGDTLSGGLGNDSINGGNGDNILNGGGGNDTVLGGTGNDTIDVGLGSDSVDGGAGDDVLVVNYASTGRAGYGLSSYVYPNANGSLNGTFSAFNGSRYDQVTFNNIEHFDVTGTGYADILYGGVFSDTLRGGGGNDYIHGGNSLTGSNDNVLDGGEGNDTLISGTGNDSINGGAGNDTITAGGGIDTIDGGTGVDVLTAADFSTATANLVFDDTGSTHEPIILANGSSVYGIELFGNLNTGSGNDQIIFTQRGDNILNTGLGDDIINAGLGNDSVDGGAGDDVLVVNYASTGRAGYGLSSSVYLNANGSLNGTFSAFNGSRYDQVTFNNIEHLNLTGTSFNDTLRGGTGSDTLAGGDGNDVFVGALGNDVLTGGTGQDRFTFNVANEGIDTISDFQTNVDDIYISPAGFGGGLVASGAIATSQFLSGSGFTAATDSNQRFIYNTSTGALFFDADGNGTSSAAIQFATLTNAPTLAHTDIFVTT
jgi:Ca2+-binding RTX toxin-like protein